MNKHSPNTKPVAPVVYSASTVYDKDAPGESRLVYGTVRREVQGDHITYVIQNRMGVDMVVDADSIDCLIAALNKARAQDQL
jgi:hypothetical protein